MENNSTLNNELGTFVTYNPMSVQADTSEHDALAVMQQLGINHLPVVDQNHQVVGMISSIDIHQHQNQLKSGATTHQGSPVCDFMSHRVTVVQQSDCPLAALDTMLEGGFHSLPVVDQGRLVGIISSSDYLREYSYGELPPSQELVSKHQVSADACIQQGENPQAALQQMENSNLDYLAVVAGKLPVGIVSKKTLVRSKLPSAENSCSESQSELVVSHAPIVRTGDLLSQAAAVLVESKCRATIVSDRSNHYRGLLTEDHILWAIARALR